MLGKIMKITVKPISLKQYVNNVKKRNPNYDLQKNTHLKASSYCFFRTNDNQVFSVNRFIVSSTYTSYTVYKLNSEGLEAHKMGCVISDTIASVIAENLNGHPRYNNLQD